MKRKKILSAAFVFMFLSVSFWLSAAESVNNPVAVSPGSDTEAVSVWQSCPTFSWSAVEQASSYRIAVFEVVDPKLMEYESAAALASPVISKDIPGPALSWSLPAEESLKTGNLYAWYVQAVDANGNALGKWSKGRIFKVKQEVRFVGIEEKLGEILKSYGVSEEVITGVLKDMDSQVKEVSVPDAGSIPTTSNSDKRSGVQGYEGTRNTFYGGAAGASNPTGDANTFIGYASGYITTTGFQNTFIGADTGLYNTTGSSNIFIGYEGGFNNTTGYQNIFVGEASGFYNTTGYSNTFLGYLSGNHNTTGSYNTFIGQGAGYSNSTGYENTFLGLDAGYYNTTGIYNSFLGLHAGYKNTTGSANTFLGYASGYNNTTGYENTFLGYQAGVNTTIGNYNTLLGYRAGYSNSSGSNNTFLGNNAGYSNTIGEGNLFLGYNAGYNETGSDKLYISNSDTSSPLIYGEFDNDILTINGKLGIGTKTPTYVLEVNRTGTTANFACKQTDGASAIISADSSHVFIGAKTNHDFRLLANDSPKITILPSGNVGFSRNNPSYPIHMASGAYCSTGGNWTNASSRKLKENIESLRTAEAVDALNRLNPVKYNYKVDKTDKHVGFIAEDVPDLVASADRKGMSPMDVIAVLTKVVQEQQKIIADLQERMAQVEKK